MPPDRGHDWLEHWSDEFRVPQLCVPFIVGLVGQCVYLMKVESVVLAELLHPQGELYTDLVVCGVVQLHGFSSFCAIEEHYPQSRATEVISNSRGIGSAEELHKSTYALLEVGMDAPTRRV